MTAAPAPAPNLRAAMRPVARAGLLAAVALFGGIGSWSALAPLSSAAIAPGVVSPESSRKTVQHLEGGIVAAILVAEGDRVEAGDVLVRLSPVQARATLGARERQWRRLEAERLRLQALAAAAPDLSWPERLRADGDADLAAFLANQEMMFAGQRRALAEKQAILDRRADQIRAEIDALASQAAGLREQAALLAEEIAGKEALAGRGLLRKPELLGLKRLRAELVAGIAANRANAARASQRLEEAAIAKVAAETEFRGAVAAELARVAGELAPLEEALAANADVLRRTEVVAPVAGTVIGLRLRTPGGIVRPGEPILDIVPGLDALVIEARLSPDDIDSVAVGQHARVHLTPYAARDLPPLEGRLTQVDADSTVDELTRERYYRIRVAVDPAPPPARDAAVRPAAGMPAEVYIATGEHTLAGYLAAPIVQSFRRAFREG